jgi:hypothetical protein
MRPRPRIRKTIKWGGAAVTVLLGVVWIANLRWDLDGHVGEWDFGVTRGSLFLAKSPLIYEGQRALEISTSSKGPAWWFHRATWALGWECGVPLWMPAVLATLLSVVAWRFQVAHHVRAVSFGVCPKCDYDRAGIAADAKCPECGSAAP